MSKPVLKQIHINEAWCKGCGICVAFCPKEVLVLQSNDKAAVAKPEDCIVCYLCEMRCPDLAISVEIEEPAGRRNGE